MESHSKRKSLPATTPGPRPADYPVGSLESRAAARSMITAREASEGEGELWRVTVVGSYLDENGERKPRGRTCTCKVPPAGWWTVCSCAIGQPPVTYRIGSPKP